jgi:hypothetical protein
MHKSLVLTAACAATAALAACSSEPETIVVNRYDAQAEALANAAPVELPPSIVAARAYRCRDNSLVYIDFYSNNTATIRNQRGGDIAATVTSPDGTAPYTADGYSVSGNTPSITYAAPGKGSQSCRS